ncbi:hypothetical protein [Desulfurobacterium indicum]|uniref:Uncharacterized protein n=1 Tax=Desulfurobacterium indicum TaxID=1914305 RepID=A0A1R1MKL8_9BACT|nr:hypothetical protein [Desulfurobacterium indicum]OMH40352.1 hypothetical protein BLW93_05660 [Desulfurobacterium indicum]
MIRVSLDLGFGLSGMKNKGEKKNGHSLFDILFSAFSESEKAEILKREGFLPQVFGNSDTFLFGRDGKTFLLNKEGMPKCPFAYELDKEVNGSEKENCSLKNFEEENPNSFGIFKKRPFSPLKVSNKWEYTNLKKHLLKAFNFSEKETDNRPKNINLLTNAQKNKFQSKLKLSKDILALKHADSKSKVAADFSSKEMKEILITKDKNQEKNKNHQIIKLCSENGKPTCEKKALKTVASKNLSENEKKKIKQKVDKSNKRVVNHVVEAFVNSEKLKSLSDIPGAASGYFKGIFKEKSKVNNKTSSRQTVSTFPSTLSAVPILTDRFRAKRQVVLINQKQSEEVKANFRYITGFDNININKKNESLVMNFDKLPVDEIQKKGAASRNNVSLEDTAVNKAFVEADSKLMKEVESGNGKSFSNGSLPFTEDKKSGEKRPLVINAQKFGKKPIFRQDKRFKVVSHKGHFDLTFSEDKTLTSKVKSDLIDSKEIQLSNMSVSPGQNSSHKVNLSHENISQAPVVSQKPLHDGSNANGGFSHTDKGQENQAANSGMKYTLTATFEDIRVKASMVRKFLNISIELPQAVFNTAGLSDEIREILSNTNLSGFRVKIKSRGKNLYSETFYKEEESSSVEIRV